MLTETKVKNAKPKAKPQRLADGRGFYLAVMPALLAPVESEGQ